MTPLRSFVHRSLATACLVAALSTANAFAQQTPYGAYPTTAYQQAGAYQGYPAANGYYQPQRVAARTPDQVVSPHAAPIANGAMPYQETYGQAMPNQPANTAGGCSTCATGANGSVAGSHYGGGGCGAGNYGAGLGYGVGTLFGGGGSCGYGAGSGGRLGVGYGAGYGVGNGVGFGGGCRHWFGGVYGIYMKRDHDNEVWLSWDGADLASAILGSHDAGYNWQAGTEVRFGSTFAGANLAWEVVYWGLHDDTEFYGIDTTATVGSLNSSLDFSGLEYDNGGGFTPVNDFYDDAQNHRVGNHFEVTNIEINLIKFPIASCVGPCGVTSGGGFGGGGGAYASPVGGFGGNHFGGMYGTPSPCGPRFTIVGTAGVRYLKMSEWFDFDTDDTDTTWGNSADELYYDIDMENHLIGFQIGCAANFRASNKLSFYCDSKFGVYGNHMSHRSLIYGSGGFARVTAGLPYAGENFDVSSTKDDVALLGELRLGGSYVLRSNCGGQPSWRAFAGYRAVGVAGVALPTNQVPANFADTHGVAGINSNGSIILHGLEAGVELTY